MDQAFCPNDIKVNDLRDELKRRRLNPIGTKAILLQRLSTVLSKEGKTLQDFANSRYNVDDANNQPARVVEADISQTTEDCVIGAITKGEEVQPRLHSVASKEETIQSEQIESQQITLETIQENQSISKEKHDSSNEYNRIAEVDQSEEQDRSELQDDLSKGGHSSDRDGSSERDCTKSESRPRSRDRNNSCERDQSISYDHSFDRTKHKTPPRQTREISITVDEEIDGWEKKDGVFLDMYNSDISLIISQDGFSARPLTDDGFSLMWAGARANFGIKRGKSFFEVKVNKELLVENLESLVSGDMHVLRLGWSTNKAGLALGEEANTYGYGGTGKKSSNGKFEDYGCKFKEGDVLGAFLEMTDSEAIMSFSVNGDNQGECYRISKSSLDDNFAMFPHIYVKNVEFMVNFGQENQPSWFPPRNDPDSWKSITDVPPENRVRARLPPVSRAECEVIMMVGLPGAGKTVYANNLCKEKPEKQYNIIGTNLILDKMKVTGLMKKRNYHGRWDVLIDKSNQCLNKLISVACKRRRNYILDQTNVYPSAQRRKMRPFEGFQRRAIVIVPTDEEFKRRIDQRSKEEGKDVPEKAVLEMKANFEIPKSTAEDSSSVFDEIIFTELQRDEAEALVKQYNAEGKASRQAEKRHHTDSSDHREYSSGRHGEDRNYHHRDHNSRIDNYNRPGRGDYDRRDSRGSGQFDYRNDRGTGRDRGRLGPRYRDEGRDLGNREGGRYGNSGRFNNDGDFRNRGRGTYGGGYQRSPRGRGSFSGSSFPPDRSSYSGSQHDQYGTDKPPQFGRGAYRGDGGNEEAGSDGYLRGNSGGRGGYGGTGYNYYQTGERRRFDLGGDSSGGAPPAKQPAIGEGQYRGSFQGDGGSYRGAFRGSRGGVGNDRGASFGARGGSYSQASQGPSVRQPAPTYPGTYYGSYGHQQPRQQGLPKSDDSAPNAYPSGGFGRGDGFQKSQQRGSGNFGGSGRTSRFTSATPAESVVPDTTSPQAVTSRYRSNYAAPQTYDSGKDSQSQQSRSRFDQSGPLAQQTQSLYEGGNFKQPNKGRQPPSMTGYTQGYGNDFANQGTNRQQQQQQQQQVQQQKPSQQGIYGSSGGYGGDSGGGYGNQQSQTADPSQKYYKGYGDDQISRAFNKPGQQQGYTSEAYTQRAGGSANPAAPKFQHSYDTDFQTGKTQSKHSQEPQGVYQVYGGVQQGSSSNKPSQQSGYGVDAYGMQSGASSGQSQQSYSSYGQQGTVAKSGQSFQQSFDSSGYSQRPGGPLKPGQPSQKYSSEVSVGGTAAGYGQHGSISSKSDPRSYDYSTGVNYASYGYGSAFNTGGNTSATSAANIPVSTGGAGTAAAATSSLYASALNAVSKSTSDSSRTATQGYASTAPPQLPQASSYGYGSGSYYGGTTAASGTWPFSSNPPAGGGDSQQQQQGGPVGGSGTGYGYSQR